MPRVKPSVVKRVDSGVTSSVDMVAQPDAAILTGKAEDGAPDSAPAKVGPKKVRAPRVKPCVRCEERRAREREYAKNSRLRHRLSTAAASSAASGDVAPAQPADPAPTA